MGELVLRCGIRVAKDWTARRSQDGTAGAPWGAVASGPTRGSACGSGREAPVDWSVQLV
jgi:hypothetical protein